MVALVSVELFGVSLDAAILKRLAEENLFRDNVIDSIDDDTVAIVIRVSVEFVCVRLESLISVC